MSSENNRKMQEYHNECQEVRRFNEEVEEELRKEQSIIDWLVDSNRKREIMNKNNTDLRESYSNEISSLVPMPVPEVVQCPAKPHCPEILTINGIGPYKKDLAALRSEVDRYIKACGVYEQQMKDKVEGEILIQSINKDIMKLSGEIGRYERFEHALRVLPQEEVMSQKNRITLENYAIDFSDGFDVKSADGIPYECMSSGERLKLNTILCLKFQNILPRSMGWCFVDDADLLQNVYDIPAPEGMQMFYAHVSCDEDCQCVNLHGTN